MTFTDKEIELAGDMKETGLEWSPEEGDWFADGASTTRLVVMATDKEFSDVPYAIWTYRGNGYSWDARDYIWLPLWHQCREILSTQNVQVTLTARVDGIVEIICYRAQKQHYGKYLNYLGSIKSDTDLNTMYQAILMYVLDAPRIADGAETGN